MINLKKILTPLTLGLTLWGILSSPAKADRVIIINQPSTNYPYYNNYPYRSRPNTNTNFIYGSPIPTSAPVNPYTGISNTHQNHNNYHNYQNYNNYPYGYSNNRVIYHNNYPTSRRYYTPSNGSSFYYNSSSGQFYINID